MANGFLVSQDVAIAMMNAIGTNLDSDTGAVIEIYSGTPPTTPDTALSGNTLLSRLNCSKPAFSGVAISGSGATAVARGTFATIATDNSAAASGTATFFRLYTKSSASAGVCKGQGTVGQGGTFDLVLNTTSITAGSQVSINAATLDQPVG